MAWEARHQNGTVAENIYTVSIINIIIIIFIIITIIISNCVTKSSHFSKTSLMNSLLDFPVDRDNYEFFGHLQSNVFNAPSLFQTTHVVHWSAAREAITFSYHVMFIHNVFNSPRGVFCLP